MVVVVVVGYDSVCPDPVRSNFLAQFAVAVVDGADGSGSAIAAAMAQGCWGRLGGAQLLLGDGFV